MSGARVHDVGAEALLVATMLEDADTLRAARATHRPPGQEQNA